MLAKKDLFRNEHIDLLSPHSFEFLNHFIAQLGYSMEQYDEQGVKEEVLRVLKMIFDLDLLKVYKWMDNSASPIDDMSTEETIDKIDKLWIRGMEYPHFYGIALFGPTDWYLHQLESLGITPTTNWKTFVVEKIGDLEEWIESNRPKEV